VAAQARERQQHLTTYLPRSRCEDVLHDMVWEYRASRRHLVRRRGSPALEQAINRNENGQIVP
jgi:hypothetical protein